MIQTMDLSGGDAVQNECEEENDEDTDSEEENEKEEKAPTTVIHICILN